jgi:hypothetical protein
MLTCAAICYAYAAMIGARVYVPYRGCEMEVRHLKPPFDLGQVTIDTMSLSLQP